MFRLTALASTPERLLRLWVSFLLRFLLARRIWCLIFLPGWELSLTGLCGLVILSRSAVSKESWKKSGSARQKSVIPAQTTIDPTYKYCVNLSGSIFCSCHLKEALHLIRPQLNRFHVRSHIVNKFIFSSRAW